MRDQVKKLHNLGVSAVSIESDEEAKALDRSKKGTILYYIAQHAESLHVEDKVNSRMVCALAIDA